MLGGRKRSRTIKRKRGGQQQQQYQQQEGDYENQEKGGQQQQQNDEGEGPMSGGKKCTGYCVSCKNKRSMKSCKNKKTKNGRNMVVGVCASCGTKMAKFVK
jgi:hypothetical protein